ncbi:hypothetical protein, partial [Escherichia coli]|uniref:hypothetical protein n=1 Tax=Escherichia coli TaxID=562 RepID=UPI0025A07B9E
WVFPFFFFITVYSFFFGGCKVEITPLKSYIYLYHYLQFTHLRGEQNQIKGFQKEKGRKKID